MSFKPFMSTLPPTNTASMTWFVYAPRNAVHEILMHAAPDGTTCEWIDSNTTSAEELAGKLPPSAVVVIKFAPDLVDFSTHVCKILTSRRPDIHMVGSGRYSEGVMIVAAMRAGAREFIDITATSEEIRHQLLQILHQMVRENKEAVSTATSRSKLVLLIGARAGVGSSTLAAHFAVQAQLLMAGAEDSEKSHEVMLLDLGRPAGDAYLNLGLSSQFHYDDALRDVDRLDATLIRAVIAQHPSKLRVLGQPVDCLEAPRGGPPAMALIDRMRRHTDLIVADLGGLAPSQIPSPLLQAADKIWLVTTPDMASILSLDHLLKRISPDLPRDNRIGLIVNRHHEHTGIDPRQLASRFDLPLLAILPDSQQGLRSSINQGRLVHELHPRHKYLQAIRRLLPLIGLAGPAAAPSWLGRLQAATRASR